MKFKFNFILLFILCALRSYSQDFTFSGYVQDSKSGEKILGATIIDSISGKGTSSNNYGYYSLTLPKGKVVINISHISFNDIQIDTTLTTNMKMNIDLESRTTSVNQVNITATKSRIHETTEMSTISISGKDVKKIPSILGEPDLIKALQLLPGVHGGSEGSAGFYVRGGGPDQNLMLLDGAPLYNVSHLFGFFSAFNPDAINNVTLIKGGFPARYGGRLSSVVDISMKEGNMKEYHGEGSIGLIASRLMIEGPIIKNKASFMISARRTYFDILTAPFIAASNDGITTGIYFYDLNAKINYKISDKDRVFLSAYNGQDKLYMKEAYGSSTVKIKNELWWGNLCATGRWNRIINPKLFMNTSLIYSRYKFDVNGTYEFNLGTVNATKSSADYQSGIYDWMAKVDFDYTPNPNHYIRFGANHTYHTFTTGVLTLKEENNTSKYDTAIGPKPFFSNESHLYIEDDYKINNRIKANIGMHLSGALLRDKYFPSIEPRANVRYLLDSKTALKASYTWMRQYVHLLSTSTIGLPTDLWVPATDRIPPQYGWQAALGIARPITIKKQVFELSVEGYYKQMQNVIMYKEGATYFNFNKSWEDMVEVGKGNAYGAEFLFQKKYGKLTGWVGYTLSWTNRQFTNINHGKEFPYRYDRRNDISIVAMYDITDKISISATWVYGTGNSVTLPEYQYQIPNANGSGYTSVSQPNSINGFKMPATHRLDVNISVKKQKKHILQTWMFGAYNAYNRQNAFYLYNDMGTLKQMSLFPIIPSLSYNFKF